MITPFARTGARTPRAIEILLAWDADRAGHHDNLPIDSAAWGLGIPRADLLAMGLRREIRVFRAADGVLCIRVGDAHRLLRQATGVSTVDLLLLARGGPHASAT